MGARRQFTSHAIHDRGRSCGSRSGVWGFAIYLVSNAAWIFAAWVQGQWPLLAQQIVFMASSGLGIWVWLLKPALAAIDQAFDL